MNKAVFLSYASQDNEAARRICEALRTAGVEVWFDQSELRGGDAWDQKIRKQIKECALFLPVISANSQHREEGYFRLEWHLAEQRSLLIARGRPFIVPVCVDETGDAEALVPDAFLTVQWMRVPKGEATAAFCDRIKVLLGGEAVGAPSRRDGTSEPETRRKAASAILHSPRWVKPVVGSAVFVALILAVTTWRLNSDRGTAPRSEPTANTQTVGPLSAGDKLVERAAVILAGTARTREQIDTANGLLEQAMALEPTNAAAWTAAARADLMLIFPYGYDRSPERRQSAMSRAARALNLAPDSFATQVVHTAVMAHASGNPALTREAEATFRRMILGRPGEKNLKLQLAEVLREERRYPEAAAVFEQIGEHELAGWSWFENGNYLAAYEPVKRAVAEQRTATAVQLKTTIEANWFQDLSRAQATVEELQPSELQSEIAAAIAIRLAFHRRDPERILQIINALPHDFMDSHAFFGPRQYWSGWAHQLAGRSERAKIDWRKGLSVLATARAAAPERLELIGLEAEIDGLLGDTAAAEKALREAERVAGQSTGTVTQTNYAAYLSVRQYEPALAWLDSVLRNRTDLEWPFLHAVARFSPTWDGFRGNPRFEQLIRETAPKEAKPFDDPKPEAKL